ncbi:MAG TPA: ROK family transcriptional regulator [Nakamurella sp.]|nr:ROK family transcriptional regulator [Nakamurella sp.]
MASRDPDDVTAPPALALAAGWAPGATRVRPVVGGPTAVRQANVREHNLGLVLGLIVNAANPPSRADIAAATGLTRATVSALTDRLIAGGLVDELPPVMSQRAGRPAVPLIPAARTIASVGMEVNVDYLGIRVMDLAGTKLAEQVQEGDFRASDPTAVLARLARMYTEVLGPISDEIPSVGACLAVPGLVDRITGPLRFAPNLRWRNVDVAGLFTSAAGMSGVELLLGNEATLAARAEAAALRHTEIRTFLYLSGDVGIGGALVVDGAVFAGRHGWSGEIGHTVVDPAGPRCVCGSTGCLEQYAGKDALMHGAAMDLALPVTALTSAAEHGDERALRSLSDGAAALGTALANAVNLVDVGTVVLGGIYAPLAPYLLPGITEQLQGRVLSAPWSTTQVLPAQARDYAALSGAASVGLAQVTADPSAWLRR